MNIKQNQHFANGNAGDICFGLDRATDEKSLVLFLKRFADENLLATLVPRLKEQEIDGVLDLLSDLLRTHLNDKEYHALFLEDGSGSDRHP